MFIRRSFRQIEFLLDSRSRLYLIEFDLDVDLESTLDLNLVRGVLTCQHVQRDLEWNCDVGHD